MMASILMGMCSVFPAYLRGIETPHSIATSPLLRCFQPTYEGLKRKNFEYVMEFFKRFQPTYEGLKRRLPVRCWQW